MDGKLDDQQLLETWLDKRAGSGPNAVPQKLRERVMREFRVMRGGGEEPREIEEMLPALPDLTRPRFPVPDERASGKPKADDEEKERGE